MAVNDQPALKVNVHSSGALTGSFLHAIVDVPIPGNARLTVSVATGDVAVDIDRLTSGGGDLGLPPDIWNLPPLPVADGAFAPDWQSQSGTVASGRSTAFTVATSGVLLSTRSDEAS